MKKKEPPPLQDDVQASLDLRGGKVISAYVLKEVVDKLQNMKEDESLELVTDAFAGLQSDILAWGRLTGNPGVSLESSHADYHRYIIMKKENVEESGEKKHIAIVVSSDRLDELLTPLGFALSAACSGMDVSLFFQGPGVHALHKRFKGRLSGWMAIFSVFARKALADTGHLPPTQKLEQLHELGAKFYACHPSLDHFGVPLKDTLFPDDIVMCEYVTFLEVMQDANTIKLYT